MAGLHDTQLTFPQLTLYLDIYNTMAGLHLSDTQLTSPQLN